MDNPPNYAWRLWKLIKTLPWSAFPLRLPSTWRQTQQENHYKGRRQQPALDHQFREVLMKMIDEFGIDGCHWLNHLKQGREGSVTCTGQPMGFQEGKGKLQKFKPVRLCANRHVGEIYPTHEAHYNDR